MKKIYILLFLIIIFGSVLRIYRIDTAPPSLSWDEAAVGFNAWSIANYGKDEYGKFYPFYFKSFGDDKHPVHIYMTALSTKILGLSEFSTRLPSAFFGILNIILIFYLVRIMFNSNTSALLSAFFLAISPFGIHFSRFNHEANFALFFYMLALLLFYLAIKSKRILLPLAVLSFGISFITYHPSKIIVPITLFLLLILYKKEIFIQKKLSFFLSIGVGIIFFLIIIINKPLLGVARINQTSSGLDDIRKTRLFKITNNEFLGRLDLLSRQYSWHFNPDYLFLKGDKNPRLSNQHTGQFYLVEGVLILIGFFSLLKKRSKEGLIILIWALLAPLPSAFTAEAPHSARAMFMMGSWQIIAALGFNFTSSFLKNPILKKISYLAVFGILFFSLSAYLTYYYGEYVKRNGIDWQYGMKEIVQYAKDNEAYSGVYVTPIRSQPYIFFLYYLKFPLDQYLNSVIYNNSEDKSYNSVAYFDKYFFKGWNPFESISSRGVLYALSPSEYDGLKSRDLYDVKKVIYYPNGTTAFFLVSLK